MKKMCYLILLIFFCSTVYGSGLDKELQFWLGPGLARYHNTYNSAIPEFGFKTETKSTFFAGFALSLKKNESPLGFRFSLEYLRKGTNERQYDLGRPVSLFTYNLDVLSHCGAIRIIVFSGKLRPYFLAGYDASLVLKHSLMIKDPLNGSENLTSETKKFDLAAVGGVGIMFPCSNLTPFLEFRYYLGLVNIYNGNYKTRTLLFSAGLSLPIFQKKS